MHFKKLMNDSRANASFAFAAVIILVSVIASSAAVYQMEKADQKLSASAIEAESAEKIKVAIVSETELAIQASASKTLNSMKQPFNLTIFQSGLSILLKEYFKISYPKKIGKISVNVTLQNLSAVLSPYADKDSSNATQPGGIVISASLRIAARSEKLNYRTAVEISKEVKTPMPFFANKIEHVDKCAKSEGLLGRTVKNILVQLVQLRVLQGYGTTGHAKNRGSSEILTAKDVEFAINLALALTELSDFGVIDQRTWESILSESGGNSELKTSNDWFRDAVDPFRTLMLLKGNEIPNTVNMRDFATQILYSNVDRFVLRYLEYMHLIDLSNTLAKANIIAHLGWQSIVEFLTGIDPRTEETKDWVSARLQQIGVPQSIWKDIFGDAEDIMFKARPAFVYIFDKHGNLVPVIIGKTDMSLDLPAISILNSDVWKEFSDTILKNAITTGGSAERIIKRLCVELSKKIPQIEVGFSQNGKEAALLEILNKLSSSFNGVDVNNLDIDENVEVTVSEDELIVALAEFITNHWRSLFRCDEIHSSARNILAAEAGATAIADDPSILPDNWRNEVKAVVTREIDDGYLRDWDVILEGHIRNASKMNEQMLIGILQGFESREMTGSAVMDGIVRWMADGAPIQLMIGVLSSNTDSLSEQLGNFTKELYLDERVGVRSNDKIELSQEPFGNARIEIAPVLNQSPSYLKGIEISSAVQYSVENIDSTGRLCICIASPSSSSQSRPKSIHHTALDGVPLFPYETNWKVRARGSVEIALCDQFNPKQISNDRILIDLDIPITVFSGWALEDVRYESSNTLLGDFWNLLVEIKNLMWKILSPLLEVLSKAFAKLYDGLTELSKYITGFVEKVGKLFFDFGNWILSVIKNAVDWLRSSPIWDMLEICFDTFGNIEFRFNYGPLGVIVSLSLPDLLFRKAKDLIRIIFVTSLDNLKVAWGFRVAKLSDGTIDIVTNASIRCRSLRLEMRLDPIMAIRDYFFEIDAFWRDLHVRIWSPEIDDYKMAGVELKDIPGLGAILSRIPLPTVGTSLSINAGLHLKYRLPISDQIGINEVELNPKGTDAGREWVEIYNPTAREIRIDGYQIETMHGEIAVLDLKGSISPYGYRVFTFPKNSLDNGDPGDTFAVGDSVILRNEKGNAIDITPLISDTDNDENTWHRKWDGAPKWEFGKPSKGTTNGNPLIHTYPDLMTKIVFDAMMLAFEDEQDNVSFSIGFVINLVKSFLRELIRVSADFIANLVYEVELFVDIGINDLTGSLGVGTRLKISFGAELIRQGILWFMEQFVKLLGNLLLRMTIAPNLLGGARPAEAIDLCAEFYCRIGTPKMLTWLLKSDDIPLEVRLASSFSVNLALLGMFFGKQWGKYCVKFGLHVDDLPGLSLINPLRLDRGRVDLWLLRGQLTPA